MSHALTGMPQHTTTIAAHHNADPAIPAAFENQMHYPYLVSNVQVCTCVYHHAQARLVTLLACPYRRRVTVL
jgi:hypothetical protein